ncbi:MAG: 4-(cytidine 5'-diphospho)-2-C-methyl-D-erythritol kinase, partial [Clostridia bacterium]|nr:4-(cytidine 5'-diphospho)-2-C-methyl-D-erythritol kinase [Clostridia bacterium]
MKITAFAFAKVNLFLKVLGKRNDGLHNLDMVMQSVSLADKVTATTDEAKGLTIVCDGAEIEDNIAEKAALKYFEKAGMAIPDIKFDIEKHIPISGGLAGGSADAAAVLILC